MTNNDSGKLFVYTGSTNSDNDPIEFIPPLNPISGFYIYFYSKNFVYIKVKETVNGGYGEVTGVYGVTIFLIYWNGEKLTVI